MGDPAIAAVIGDETPQWSPVAITGMGDPAIAAVIGDETPQWSPVAITGMGMWLVAHP